MVPPDVPPGTPPDRRQRPNGTLKARHTRRRAPPAGHRAQGGGDRLGGRNRLPDHRLLAAGGDRRHLPSHSRHHQDHHLLHVRLPLRHPRPPEGRPHPLHRGQPRPSGQQGRAVRQGFRRHHEPLLPGPPAASRCCALASAAAATSRRSNGRRRWPSPPNGSARSGHRAAQARLLHRPRPEPVLHRLVGQAVRHPQFRRAWRLLLGQHGGGRPLHRRRQFLGIRRRRLGPHEVLADVRRRRGSRFQPDQARHRQTEGARREVRVGEPGEDGLLRRRRRMDRPSPGHRRPVRAVAGARIAASPTASTWISWPATPTPPGWCVSDPGSADDGLFVRDADGKPLAWDRAAWRRSTPPRPACSRRSSASSPCPTAVTPTRSSTCWPNATWTAATRRRWWRTRCGIPAATIRRIAARAGGRRLRPGDRARSALDRHIRPAARDDARPPGGDARDARHLRAFQRVPHLPRHSRAANAAGCRRYSGLLALQVAVPQADPARSAARRQRQQAERHAARHGAGQSARPRGPAAGGRRQRRCASTRRSPGTRRCPRTG